MKKVINNEQIFTESASLRDEYIDRVDILDKIKIIPYLTKDLVVSVKQVASYYEVTNKAIQTITERHRDELEDDGIMVLRGAELKEFKKKVTDQHGEDHTFIGRGTPNLTIMTRRAMLRIGMLLTTSGVAVKIRNYLLNLEENSTLEQKKWAIQREASKIDRKRMTTAINKYIPESKNKRFAYPNYTNMLYKILFNKTAKEIREEKGLLKNSELTRDNFTEKQLKDIEEGETIITALLSLGFNYKYIEEQLRKKYKKELQ